MKKNKFVLCLLLVLVLIVGNVTFARQDSKFSRGKKKERVGQDGNAGAGIYNDGRYMTFYSAGFYTEPRDMEAGDIPSLVEMMSAIRSIPGLSQTNKVKYLDALAPADDRQYYKVKEDYFSKETRDRLIEEYVRVTKAPHNKLALFAVTDVNSKTTYLLPEFYELPKVEQMAILFHEGYWLAKSGTITYDTIVDVEGVMQAYLEESENYKRVIRLLKMIGDVKDIVAYAIDVDIRSGVLDDLYDDDDSEKKIKLSNLIGDNATECYLSKTWPRDYYECDPLWDYRVYELKEKYPRSLFVSLLNRGVTAGFFPEHYGKKKARFVKSAYLILKVYEHESCMQVEFEYVSEKGGNWSNDIIGKDEINFCFK